MVQHQRECGLTQIASSKFQENKPFNVLCIRVFGIIVFFILSLPFISYAQNLEDSIEAELDKIEDVKPTAQAEPEGAAEGKPEAKQEVKLEELSAPSPNEVPSPQPEPVQSAQKEPPAAGFDEPNYNFEKRVFNIFHGAKPVSSEKWSEMIGSRREDIYQVQPGDTLWDISKTMFGDGFFWSKIWAENRSVENPHRIAKGQNIRFVSGNEDSGPSIDVVDVGEISDGTNSNHAKGKSTIEVFSETSPGTIVRLNSYQEVKGVPPVYREQAEKEIPANELESRTAVEVDELIAQPEMPPLKKTRPVLKNLPQSFEEPAKATDDRNYDITGLDAGKVRSLTIPATTYAPSYIADSTPVGIGTVYEIETGEKVASSGQYIFLKMNHAVRVGDKFSIIKPLKNIKDSKRGSIGPVVECGGIIEIESIVDNEKNIFRAIVLTNVNPVRVGSIVSTEALPRANFARKGTLLNTEVRIIGGEFDEARKILGESSLVYLDGGADAGLTVGDVMPVQARRGQRRLDSKIPNWNKSIGVLKVIKVDKKVATAVIIEAHEEIRPGDKTGGKLPSTNTQYQEPSNEVTTE